MTERITLLIERFGERRILLVIALVALLAQLICLRPPTQYGEPYLIAKNIVAGKGFVFVYPLTERELPTCYATPLYTYLQVPILLSGLGERGIQLFNILLLQLGCLAIFSFFRKFVVPPIALVMYLAVSFFAPFWILAYSLEPNALNLLLVVLTIDRFYELYRGPSRRLWVQLGILFGVQLLLRPDILIGAACLGLWLVWMRRDSFTTIVRGLAIATAIGLLMALPWTVRNYLVFDKFVLVSANSGMNLYEGNNPLATGEFASLPSTPESQRLEDSILTFSRNHDQVETDQLRMTLAKEWILAHPGETLALDLRKVQYHWFGRAEFGEQFHYAYKAITPIFLSVYALLTLLGFYGLWRLRGRGVTSLMIALFTYSTAVSAIFFVQSRHRALKVDPFIIPLALVGIAGLGTIRQPDAFGRLLTPITTISNARENA